MEEINVNDRIKKEFEERINNIEAHDKRRKKIIITLINMTSVLLFIIVLSATIMSVNNYIRVKQQYEASQAQPNTLNVVDLEIK